MSQAAPSVLGIVAGGGRLPVQLAEACASMKRPVFVLGFDGVAKAEDFKGFPFASIKLGSVGAGLDKLRQAGAHEIVLAGKMQRPGLFGLMPDSAGTRLLAHIGAAFFSGDDTLLKAILTFLEEEGFKIVGSEEVLASLLTTEGVLGKIVPTKKHMNDIERGFCAARDLGKRDAGQAVIVENGEVLCEEDQAGTDALITRASLSPQHEKGCGVLVKAKKPKQETRIDLPAIGPDTVRRLHQEGFSGIALEAGASLILDKERTIAEADKMGLFIIGVRHG